MDSSNKISITMIRHGHTLGNIAHLLQGHTPGVLSPLGEKQVNLLGKRLVDETYDLVYCSDSNRCR